MNICVIGTGYVGLTTGSVLASIGHHVTCVDIDQTKINALNSGKVPIYEPGLEELIKNNIKSGNQRFTTEISSEIKKNEIIMIAVGTPPLPNGDTNLSYIASVIDTIADCIETYKIIITKSTVPPGTNEWIYNTLVEKGVDTSLFDIVSNPEFLKEGTAIEDLINPDKTVVGVRREHPVQVLKEMYKGMQGEFIVTTLNGAELIKYASNAFLATKISFMNEMARICDVYNVNITDIEKAIGTDPRIGPHFLKAGLGYGGSCFPKDVSALLHAAKKKKIEAHLLESTMEVNRSQIDVYLNKLLSVLPVLDKKKIAVWGLTFKPNTDDMRLSQSIALINRLQDLGCSIHTYDPIVSYSENGVNSFSDIYESVKDVDVLIVGTEWEVFRSPDWSKVRSLMKGNILLDGRNMLNPKVIENYGLKYLGVGRS